MKWAGGVSNRVGSWWARISPRGRARAEQAKRGAFVADSERQAREDSDRLRLATSMAVFPNGVADWGIVEELRARSPELLGTPFPQEAPEERKLLNVLRADQRWLASLALRASPEAMEAFAEIKGRSPSTLGLPFPAEPLLNLSAFFCVPKEFCVPKDIGNVMWTTRWVGKNALMAAADNLNRDAVRAFLTCAGADPNAKDAAGQTALSMAARSVLRWILREMPDEFLSLLKDLADASSEETKQQAFDELLGEAAPAAVGEAVSMNLWTCLDALADCGTDEGREKAWAYAGGPDPASANAVRAARLPTLAARREASELRAEVFGSKGGTQARPQENGVADSPLPPAKRRGGRL